jgi:hypothetical protein
MRGRGARDHELEKEEEEKRNETGAHMTTSYTLDLLFALQIASVTFVTQPYALFPHSTYHELHLLFALVGEKLLLRDTCSPGRERYLCHFRCWTYPVLSLLDPTRYNRYFGIPPRQGASVSEWR